MGQARWSYESDFAAEPASVAAAREFVQQHLSHYGLDHLTEDVRLVVSELATNSMVHARTPFTVTLTARDHSVLLTVNNLLDTYYYEKRGYPLAGIAFAVKYRFGV